MLDDVLDFLLVLLSHDLDSLSLFHLYHSGEHCPICSRPLRPKFWKAPGQAFVPSTHIFFWVPNGGIVDETDVSQCEWERVCTDG